MANLHLPLIQWPPKVPLYPSSPSKYQRSSNHIKWCSIISINWPPKWQPSLPIWHNLPRSGLPEPTNPAWLATWWACTVQGQVEAHPLVHCTNAMEPPMQELFPTLDGGASHQGSMSSWGNLLGRKLKIQSNSGFKTFMAFHKPRAKAISNVMCYPSSSTCTKLTFLQLPNSTCVGTSSHHLSASPPRQKVGGKTCTGVSHIIGARSMLPFTNLGVPG